MHASRSLNRLGLVLLAIGCAGVVACHEDAVAPRTVDTPQGPMLNLGTVIFDVDVKSGKVTAHAVAGSSGVPAGVSAKVFGAIPQIEYSFFGEPQGLATPGVVEFNLHGNISNLLDFAIGTNSFHPFNSPYPQDTMGIYAFYILPPYQFKNTGGADCAPACTVTVDSADGAYTFTGSTPQQYQYWKTILDSGGRNALLPGPFETNPTGIPGGGYYRPFSFRTTGNVGTFRFGLAMAAAWSDPHESRWKVFYLADSLPNRVSSQDLRSEPDWRVLGTGATATITPGGCTPNTNGCSLRIASSSGTGATQTYEYYRSDSVRAAQSGYIQATMTATPATALFPPQKPSIFLGLKDPAKLVQMGISTALTGFTDSTGAFVTATGATSATVSTRSTWRVAKYGADSASIFSPADSLLPLVTLPYASLPAAPVRGSGYDRFFFFGNITPQFSTAPATSVWWNVNYEIGADAP
jgi:hypothetical protein